MTEAELTRWQSIYCAEGDQAGEALIREIRRLRAVVCDFATGPHLAESPWDCPWCGGEVGTAAGALPDGLPRAPSHHDDCPAFTENGDVR